MSQTHHDTAAVVQAEMPRARAEMNLTPLIDVLLNQEFVVFSKTKYAPIATARKAKEKMIPSTGDEAKM